MLSISEPHNQLIKCPACGRDANVRYVNRSDTGLQVIGFTCPNQSRDGHANPPHRVLVEAVVEALQGARTS
jgi:hypothetical protein